MLNGKVYTFVSYLHCMLNGKVDTFVSYLHCILNGKVDTFKHIMVKIKMFSLQVVFIKIKTTKLYTWNKLFLQHN